MQRKHFLRNSIGLLSSSVLLNACKKSDDATGNNNGCPVTATEVEGPFPYPGGEVTNPLNREDVTEGQDGVLLTLILRC